MAITEPDQVCIYCGSAEEITEDHVPPQCLFEDVPKGELVAVPSCRTCNATYARDDEFLRDVIVALTLDVDMPELQAPRKAMQRSLRRKQHAGPIRRMIRRAKRAYAPLGASQILQPVQALPVDTKRLQNVIQRIVRGLHFHETGVRIPPDYLITVLDPALAKSVPTYDKPFVARVVEAALNGHDRVIGGRRFGYCFRVLSDDPCGSVWLLSFLGKLVFLCTAARQR